LPGHQDHADDGHHEDGSEHAPDCVAAVIFTPPSRVVDACRPRERWRRDPLFRKFDELVAELLWIATGGLAKDEFVPELLCMPVGRLRKGEFVPELLSIAIGGLSKYELWQFGIRLRLRCEQLVDVDLWFALRFADRRHFTC